jgi:hypothetical protein
MERNMNIITSLLKAFKRAPSLGLSQWENGNLTTNLAEKKDTAGAFYLVEAMLAPGFLPKFKPHAFVIRSPRLRVLALFTPAGLEELFRGRCTLPDSGRGCGSTALVSSTASTEPRQVTKDLNSKSARD